MKFLYITLSLLIVYLSISAVSGYTVDGNKIYDPTGKQVLLRGVDRPSFEWVETGQYASANDYALMRQWGANVVRVTMNQQFWLTTSTYAGVIDQQIAWATAVGMGVIIDLHWNDASGQHNMADRLSITFWSQVANRYKNNPWVMFELYNEPHDVSWSQWLNGDATYAGMQEMYNAVRAAGADNLCIVGGLNWAFDLSGVGQGYKVVGNHIAYATHPYDYAGKQLADWPAAFGYLATNYPVIMTEFGQYCAENTYVADLLNYAQQNNLHWTAWAWWVGGCSFPSIISDWNGTPSDGVGVLVKSYLSGNAPSTPVVTAAPSSPSAGGSSSASSSLSVYTDALASGWQDWSWASSYSLADSTYVHAGSKSIRFQVSSYGAIYLHAATPFTAASYNTLQFYINGGSSTQNVNALGVQLYDASTNAFGSTVSLPNIPANQWILVNIPITSFGVQSATVTGFAIKATGNGNTGNVWIDDIAFVPASSSVPTTAATAAPASPTSAPASTPRPTSAATQKPTIAPTQKATSAPTTAPTTKATSAPTTPAPTTKATSAPTTAPTTKATSAPTTKATSAPTTKATSAPTSKPSSGCDASNIQIIQTNAGSWPSGNDQVTQYNVEIRSTCASKKLVGLTLSATNWNPINSWSLVPSSSSNGQTTITLPAYASISSSTVFSAGYQNVGGQASFTITSYTFQ